MMTKLDVAYRISHSIPCTPAPKIPALLLHGAREHHLVHLRRAVDDLSRARPAINPLQHGVFGIAARAVKLDGDVGREMQRVGDMNLGHGNFLAGAVALIELPGGVHGEQPPDLDLMRNLAELDLHAFAV